MAEDLTDGDLLEVLGIGRSALLLLDAAPLVYLVEGDGRRRAFMEAVLTAAGRGSLRLAASAIAWTELLGKPLADGDETRATAYRRVLADAPRLVIIPLDVAVAEEAARLRARAPRLALPDAVHLASAVIAGAAAVLTNDGAWASHAPRGLCVLILDELSAAFDA